MWTSKFFCFFPLKQGVKLIFLCMCIPAIPCTLWNLGIATCSHDPKAIWTLWDTFWWPLMAVGSIFGFLSLLQGKYEVLKYYTYLFLTFTTVELFHYIIRHFGDVQSMHSYNYETSDRFTESFGQKELVEWLRKGYWYIDTSRVSILEWHFEFCPATNFGRALLFYYFAYCVYSYYLVLETRDVKKPLVTQDAKQV